MWDWRSLDSAAQEVKIVCGQVEYEFQTGTHTNPVYTWPHTTTQCGGFSPAGSSVLTHSYPVGVQSPPGKPGSVTPDSSLGRQTPSLWASLPSSFFPQLHMLSMMPYGLECTSYTGMLSWPLPTPCASQAPACQGALRAQKALTLCKCCSGTTKTSPCFQHSSQHRSKTQSCTSHTEKTNSIPVKTSTPRKHSTCTINTKVLVLSPSSSDPHKGLRVGNTCRHTTWAGTVLIHPIYPIYPAPTSGAPAPFMCRDKHTQTPTWGYGPLLLPGMDTQPTWQLALDALISLWTHTHMQTHLTVNPRPHTHPCAWPGSVASSSSCFAGRDGEISGPGYFCFDISLPSHIFHLPSSNSREPLPRDVAGHSLMRQDRWQQWGATQWPDKGTDWSFISLNSCLLFIPQATMILPFCRFWFLPITSSKFVASQDFVPLHPTMCQTPQVSLSCCLTLMDVTLGPWGWGFPGTVQQRARRDHVSSEAIRDSLPFVT